MNDFDTFRREAIAALRVALQWFFLAVPMGLLCGFVGTLFHLASSTPPSCAPRSPGCCSFACGGSCSSPPFTSHKVRGRGHQQCYPRRAERRAGQHSAGARHLSGHGAHPPVRRLCRPRGRCLADGRQHRLEPWHPAAAQGLRPPHRHHQRHGCVLLCPVRHPAGRGLLCHDGGGCWPDLYFGLCSRLYLCPHRLRLLAGLWHRAHPLCPHCTGTDVWKPPFWSSCWAWPALPFPACSAAPSTSWSTPCQSASRTRGCGSLRAACWSSAFRISSAWGGITAPA